MGEALHLNKHEPLSPNDALCQVWLKLAQWLWRRKFLDFVDEFPLFSNYLPLETSETLHLKFSTPKNAVCQIGLKICPVVLEMTNLQTDGRTGEETDGRRGTGDQKISLELSAQMSLLILKREGGAFHQSFTRKVPKHSCFRPYV